MKKLKVDFSFILAIVMQLLLIGNMVSIIVENNPSVKYCVLVTIIAMLGWGLCEYNRQKSENKK